MAITLWEYIDADMKGKLRENLVKWHVEENMGTPAIAKKLVDKGYSVEQRTVWRWLQQEGI